ncbi:MAG TPA: NUDIX domain-containing protein [Acidimicrobiales bacterium]|nr:NUDIX domain-containing protein [Acidimicrobiales bacterium]
MSTPVVRYLAAGGVVIHEGRVLVLLRPGRREVRLPKGHVEDGETLAEAALREVSEESGYADIECGEGLGEQRVVFGMSGEGRREWTVDRTEHYFRMTLRSEALRTRSRADRKFEPVFLPPEEAMAKLTFEVEREWVRRALASPDGRHAQDQTVGT